VECLKRVYANLCNALGKEIGAEPGTETVDVFNACMGRLKN
jgi:hypothetical protein